LLEEPTISPEGLVVAQFPKFPVMVPAIAGCAGFSTFTGSMLPPVEIRAVVPLKTTSVAVAAFSSN
jgi:hypothetical protein